MTSIALLFIQAWDWHCESTNSENDGHSYSRHVRMFPSRREDKRKQVKNAGSALALVLSSSGLTGSSVIGDRPSRPGSAFTHVIVSINATDWTTLLTE